MANNSNAYVPFPAQILDIIQFTEKEFTFRVACAAKNVRPGQFFEISIPKYGEAPISVSGIGEGSIDFTIRNVGVVTHEVFAAYKGQSLLIRGPYGNGFDVSRYVKGEIVVVAGGTGVSPVRGVIEALAQTDDPARKFVIVGFRSPAHILFGEDLKRWAPHVNLTVTVDGADEGYTGNVGLVTKYIGDLPVKDPATAQAIVVGPPAMMKFSILELQKRGFRDENITVSYERKMCCGLGKCGHCRIGHHYVCTDGPVFNYTMAKDFID